VAKKSKIAFPKKNAPPKPEEFAARLPLAAGKRFEAIRAFLRKQKGVSEELFYYGPKSGWAFRYLRGPQSICAVMVYADRPLGIVALDASALRSVDWKTLTEAGKKARRMAHGSPALLWLDLPLDGTGAADFKALLKSKLKTLPPPPAAPTAAGRASGSAAALPPDRDV